MDRREDILSRLIELCAGIDGVANVVRNRLDVGSLERPIIVILDGAERMRDAPDYGRPDPWRSEIQINELTPALSIHVRGSDTVDGGGLLSLYRTRVLAAVLNDATLMDRREDILSRLIELCAGIDGVANVVRNRLDVGSLERPIIVILDGAERMRDAPDYGRPDPWRSEIQINELTPALSIHVRGSDTVDGGGLLSLYRTRVLAAVLNDATLMGYVTRMNYGGAAVAMPSAEGKEYRIDLSLSFSYRFSREDVL